MVESFVVQAYISALCSAITRLAMVRYCLVFIALFVASFVWCAMLESRRLTETVERVREDITRLKEDRRRISGKIRLLDEEHRRIREAIDADSERIREEMNAFSEHIREEMGLCVRALDEEMRYTKQFIDRQVAMDADANQVLVEHNPRRFTAWEGAGVVLVALVSAYIGRRVERYQ